MTKREFLAASALSLAPFATASAQSGSRPKPRKAKTTKLFKCPSGFPNGLAVTPQGLWIGEQKLAGAQAKAYNLPEPTDLTEHAWLVDWNGKVLKTVKTPSRNTSGMAVGGGYVWMVANAAPNGVFQVDMNSKLASHRQIPLGTSTDGGGSHGAHWQDGKLWISSLRLRGNLRVDPVTWQPEFMIPFYQSHPNWVRYHDITWDNGTMWQVIGNDSTGHAGYRPGLVRYDAATAKVLEVVEFLPGSSDPHGLAMHDGKLIACDAGIHPNWPNSDSPTAGWIFQIDFV
ncbi:MAG: hypothetical protein J0L64_17980 [Acidobacteria bacterium]|nr:hypothetical protein [Acidobacteriota bacterium]